MRMGEKTEVNKKDKNGGKCGKWMEETLKRAGKINLKKQTEGFLDGVPQWLSVDL